MFGDLIKAVGGIAGKLTQTNSGIGGIVSQTLGQSGLPGALGGPLGQVGNLTQQLGPMIQQLGQVASPAAMQAAQAAQQAAAQQAQQLTQQMNPIHQQRQQLIDQVDRTMQSLGLPDSIKQNLSQLVNNAATSQGLMGQLNNAVNQVPRPPAATSPARPPAGAGPARPAPTPAPPVMRPAVPIRPVPPPGVPAPRPTLPPPAPVPGGGGGATEGLATAELRNLDGGGSPTKVMFNPNEYTFTRQLRWDVEGVRGRNVAQVEFSGGDPTTLTMQLFFDSYEERKDVRDYTEPIWKMTFIENKTVNQKNKRGRPPKVQFVWGSMWSFKAVITSITQKFTMFLPNGTPVRATMDVSFQQIDEAPLKQNPTSGGGPEVKTRIVRPRETLAWIAYDEYHDSTLWRPIAEANGIENPLALIPGQRLVIPEL